MKKSIVIFGLWFVIFAAIELFVTGYQTKGYTSGTSANSITQTFRWTGFGFPTFIAKPTGRFNDQTYLTHNPKTQPWHYYGFNLILNIIWLCAVSWPVTMILVKRQNQDGKKGGN